jgi:hypothetical protein
MSDTRPEDHRIDQFIVYGAYGEIMHQLQFSFVRPGSPACRRLT